MNKHPFVYVVKGAKLISNLPVPDKKALKVIQELDEALAKQPIPLRTSDQSEDTLSFPTWG